jgi:hypothetical protein
VRGRGGQRDRQRWAAITDPAQRHQLASCGNHTRPIPAAPLVFALVQEAGGYEFDTGRIAQNIMITATALGLATCPVTLHRDDAARHLLGLRDGQRCRYALAIGHPHPSARPARLGPRRPLQELIHHDRYTPEQALPRASERRSLAPGGRGAGKLRIPSPAGEAAGQQEPAEANRDNHPCCHGGSTPL